MSYVPEQLKQLTAFGDLAIAESSPVVQVSAQYGVLSEVSTRIGLSGTATEVGGEFVCTSGTNANGFGSVASVRDLIFRSGQGEKDLFSARFDSGIAGNEQFAGLANTISALGFGRDPATGDFGVLYRHGGAIGIQELTITTGAGGAENATITVDGTPYVVPITNVGIQQNANEIADSLNSQVPFWDFAANDDQVVANAFIARADLGGFAFTSATAVAAWVQVSVGILPTDEWTDQASWNEDARPDLDASNYNVFKIQVGAGNVFFWIMDPDTHRFGLVHIIEFNDTLPAIRVSNPSFSHVWYSLNRGSTTDLTVAGNYGGLYQEGKDVITASGSTTQNTVVGVGTTDVPLLSLRSRGSIDDVINLANTIITGIQGSSDSTKTMILTLIRNPTLTAPVFEYIDKTNSILEVDMAATAVTFAASDAIAISGLNSVQISGGEGIVLMRNEIITIAGRVTSGAASEFTATLGYIEDL